MSKKKTARRATRPDVEKLSYEQAIGEAEQIIDRIESGEIGLEESIDAYERGMRLVARCRHILSEAEQRIEELTPGPEAEED